MLRLCALALPLAAAGVSLSTPGAPTPTEDDAHLAQAGRLSAAADSASVSAMVQRLQRGDLGNASKRIEGITKLGARLTQDSWLSTGPESLQALKGKFFKKEEIKLKLQSACPWGGDCTFSQGTMLFCEALRIAASHEKLGDTALLESMMGATLMSTRFYGVDSATQGALIMRWDREEQWTSRVIPATEPAPSPVAFEGLRQRTLEKPDFQGLVDGICGELSSVRPQCPGRASDGIFCQALGQAAAVSIGAQEACNRLIEVVMGM